MLIDDALIVSDGQAVTASAASTDTIDTEVTNPNLADGSPLAMHFVCTVTCDVGTGLTFGVKAGAASADTMIAQSAAVPVASLVKGWKMSLPLPQKVGLARYISAYYTLVGTNATTGAFTAWLGPIPAM